jgi:ABC-type lipoprotein export system ATPase subunit
MSEQSLGTAAVNADDPAMDPKAAPAGLRLHGLKSELAGPFEFQLAPGRCAVIGGASGSGKSLFLRMIADLDPNEGEVSLDGVDRASLSAPDWRARVPYVAAESGWWRDDVAGHFAPGRRDAGRALAERLGLTDGQFDGEVRRLSTGERQRLAIIRALVLEAPVLLLDEPTGPLDRGSIAKVEAVLRERLQAGAAILMVSHDPVQADRLGAARYEMRDRQLTVAV